MRRHSVWLLLVVSILILSYIAEHEVMAAPDPCFLFPFNHRHHKTTPAPKKGDDDKDKEKEKKRPFRKIEDEFKKDFEKFIKEVLAM